MEERIVQDEKIEEQVEILQIRLDKLDEDNNSQDQMD